MTLNYERLPIKQNSVRCHIQRSSNISGLLRGESKEVCTICPPKSTGGSIASRLICLYGFNVDVLVFGFFNKQILVAVIQSFALHAVYFTTEINTIRTRLLIIHDSKLLSENTFFKTNRNHYSTTDKTVECFIELTQKTT